MFGYAYSYVFPWCCADDTVSSELKKQIMSARLAKKLTQAQLANLINEKPQVIQEYESGKVRSWRPPQAANQP